MTWLSACARIFIPPRILDEQTACRRRAPAIGRGPTPSVVVVMNHGLAAIAEFIFLLDHRGAVGGLALPDDGGAVAIAVPLTIFVRLSDGHTGTDRTDVNADFVGQRRRGDGGDHGGGKQIFLHLLLLKRDAGGMRECDSLFRGTRARVCSCSSRNWSQPPCFPLEWGYEIL